MILQIEPIYKCIEKIKNKKIDEIIYMSPDGKKNLIKKKLINYPCLKI